jgi:hypothetical protein
LIICVLANRSSEEEARIARPRSAFRNSNLPSQFLQFAIAPGKFLIGLDPDFVLAQQSRRPAHYFSR